jgi:hypothetical protein
MKTLLFALFFSVAVLTVQAQVSLAPTTVFADANGIGTLYVTNGSGTPQEVNISFLFGYPGNDSIGNLVMVYEDSLREQQSGLGDRIRTFPRSFILAPGQQQTVRFQIRPDRTKPDGMYFTRVKVASNEQSADVEQTATEGIATQVNFKFEQVIAAFYKSGAVTTGLEFSKLEALRKENTIAVDSEFTVSGNSPFLGSLQAEVRDSSDKVVATHQQTVALYYEGKRAYSIPLPEGIAPGTYQVTLLFKTERSDIPTSDLVQAPPISKILSIML